MNKNFKILILIRSCLVGWFGVGFGDWVGTSGGPGSDGPVPGWVWHRNVQGRFKLSSN